MHPPPDLVAKHAHGNQVARGDGAFGDAASVEIDEFTGIDPLGEFPELARHQRLDVEGHETIGEQQRGAPAAGRVVDHSRPAAAASATG